MLQINRQFPCKTDFSIFLLSMNFTHLSFAYPAGDRELDVNAIYPSDCFIQNGGNMYDITNPPGDQQAAVPNDGLDDTEAFKYALDYNLDDNHQDNGNQGNHFRTDLIFYVFDGVYRHDFASLWERKDSAHSLDRPKPKHNIAIGG